MYIPQKRHILVVDDEYFNFEILKAALSDSFNIISYAESGQSCLTAAVANTPDIILLDVCMPGLDGYDTCRMLKNTPETKHIPVIMVSGLESEQEQQAGFAAGCDAYVLKPVSKTGLLNKINHVLGAGMLDEEQRNFRRMLINAKATLITLEPADEQQYDALCIDLSATGLSLSLDTLLELGTVVKVKIDSTNPAIAPLDATAKVIRASEESDGTMTAGLEIMQFN